MPSALGLLDLPVDVLILVFPYLDACSFLSLTASCKALHEPRFVYEYSFWSSLVRRTFRYPNQPVVQNDGRHWHKLYKRLCQHSRIYTWGGNATACLGHSYESPNDNAPEGWQELNREHNSWPGRMRNSKGLGVISDLQCGGWSTTLMTSKGALYTVGVLDGLELGPRGTISRKNIKPKPVPLQYPPGFPRPCERYDPTTAVRQFSAGRQHILALSDSGRIWTWRNIKHAALNVKFLSHDIADSENGREKGAVKQVVAGWSKSAALINGTGIVLWEALQRDHDETEIEDAALILESAVVPYTSYTCPISKCGIHVKSDHTARAEEVGEVQNFIVMEDVVIFNTHVGKVFAAQILWTQRVQRVSEPIELNLTQSEDPDERFAIDVQGSFQSFAVFTRSGAVLTSKQDRLIRSIENENDNGTFLFTRVPALQHGDVIKLAFGDHHFHALHASGHITSYGTEVQSCGSLGLGDREHNEGLLRGIEYETPRGEGKLLPHAYAEGRRVWFLREKRGWLRFLISGGVDPLDAGLRRRLTLQPTDSPCVGEVSEWVEQQGRDWETKLGVRGDDDDELGTYFAMNVTAAGRHSGALILVNEDMEERLSRACKPLRIDAYSRSLKCSATSCQSVSSGSTDTASGSDHRLLVMPDEGEAKVMPQSPEFQRRPNLSAYGVVARQGLKYFWVNDHFPRIKLSDGSELPGSCPLHEWMYDPPNWDIDFSL